MRQILYSQCLANVSNKHYMSYVYSMKKNVNGKEIALDLTDDQ